MNDNCDGRGVKLITTEKNGNGCIGDYIMDGTERKLAEELWRVAQQQPGGNDVIDYIAVALKTYGEARYKAGVEAMRIAILKRKVWSTDDRGQQRYMTADYAVEEARCLLSSSEEAK